MTAIRLTATLAQTTTGSRTITGTLATFGQVGNGSIGPVCFEAGSIKPPADLKRVKLLVEHDTERPVGYLTESQDDDQAVTGTFYLPTGETGDTALQMATDGLRDGLSVGLDIREYHKDGEVVVVTEALLREVSLVAVPALDDARVTSVTQSAARPTVPEPKVKPMPDQQPDTNAPSDQADANQPPTTEQSAGATGPVAASNPTPVKMASATMDLAAAVKTAAKVLSSGPASGLEMALGSITPATDAGEGIIRPQWVGELWKASLVERPLIDAFGTRPLTGLKVQGFRKAFTDLVDAWDPDADEQIPSAGTFATTPVEVDTGYFAGGSSIDRRFIDLGSAGFVEQWFTAGTDDYKKDTEAQMVDDVTAAATSIAAQPDLLSALDVIGRGAHGRGGKVDFVLMGATVWSQFIMLKPDDVPWWLQAQGTVSLATHGGTAAGVAFAFSATLGATDVLAGDRRAAKWYEVDPPIRVQALDVAGGKVDLAVYGYGATLIEDPSVIFATTVTTGP